MEETRPALPFSVMVAAFLGFAKAVFLGFMGLIGVLTWDEVSDPWGIGALVAAAVFALGSWGLVRGSGVARLGLALLAAFSGGAALVYVFTGPTSAIVASLVTAGAAAVLIWLLYGARGARAYFAA